MDWGSMDLDGLLQTLIRTVARAFHEPREIIVIDSVIRHKALRDDDLAYLMGSTTKDIHKICASLQDHKLLAKEGRLEKAEHEVKGSTKNYYFINYPNAIDAIKWRMYTIDKEVQGTVQPAAEKKEYFCSFCKAEWTQMEVLDSVGPEGFTCHRCSHPLTFEPDRDSSGHEQSTRLNKQFKFITDTLPKIDAHKLPTYTLQHAIDNSLEVKRERHREREKTEAVEPGGSRPMAVKGLTNSGPQSIAVNISTSDGPSEAEKEAERLRKEKITQQNALPSWMSNSTVTGESFGGGSDASAARSLKVKDEEDTKASDSVQDGGSSAQIDDIFEKLKAEQAAARARELAKEEEEEESDEDEFEDVEAVADYGAASAPATTFPTKREESEVVSREESSEERLPKRVKIEVHAKPAEATEAKAGAANAEEEDDDEDDMEFEDV